MDGHQRNTDRRVLIVDEDRVRAGLVALHLRRGGLVAIVADSARAAQDALAWGAPEVLLVALGARSLDGLELVRSLDGTSTAAFFMASEAPTHEVEFEAARLGVQGFMIHPLDPGATLARIDRSAARVLGARSSSDEIVDDLSRTPLDVLWDLCWRCSIDARIEVGGGAVVLREGQPIDAWSGGLSGRDAFFDLAVLTAGPVRLVRLLPDDADCLRADMIGLDLATALTMAHAEDPPTRRDARPGAVAAPDTRMSGPPEAMIRAWAAADGPAEAEGPPTLAEGPSTRGDGPRTHADDPSTHGSGPTILDDGPPTHGDAPADDWALEPPIDGAPPLELIASAAAEADPFLEMPEDLVDLPDEMTALDGLPDGEALDGLDNERLIPADLGADDTYEGGFEPVDDVDALVASMTGERDAASWLPAGDWQDALGADDLIAEALEAASSEIEVVAPAEPHAGPTTAGGRDDQLDLGDWDLQADVLVDSVGSPEPPAPSVEPEAEADVADAPTEEAASDEPSTRDLIAATLPGFGRSKMFKRGAVAALAVIFAGLGGFVAWKLLSGPPETSLAAALMQETDPAGAPAAEIAADLDEATAPDGEPWKTPVPSLEDEVREAYGKGVIASREGNRETAARHFRHVLRRVGDHDGALAGLAAVLVDGDTIAEARIMLDVLSLSRPDDAAVQLELALVAHKQDDNDTALAALGRFLALAPQDPQAGDARRLVAALEPDAHR